VRGQQWAQALGLAGALADRGVVSDVFTLNTAISAYARAFRWPSALLLFSSDSGFGSAIPDLVSYNSALSACERGRCWREALQLLLEARLRKLELDVVSFSSAVSACSKGLQWQQALALLQEARAVSAAS
ncbi:unnamed protein product, partial [Polarella glacialis]